MTAIMQVVANIFYATWFVWPFVFVFGLGYGIKSLLKTQGVCPVGLVLASIALLLMLVGLLSPAIAG